MQVVSGFKSKTIDGLNALFRVVLSGRVLKTALYIVLPVLLALAAGLSSSVVDPFHEGEYLGNYLYLQQYYKGLAQFPVLIHGAMDYLPALLASKLKGGMSIIFYTRLFNILAVCVCWVAWVDMSRVILRKAESKYVLGFLFFLAFIAMASAAGDGPVHQQQGFLGTRDLFLILQLWCVVKLLDYQAGARFALFSVLAGFFAAASLYWSYDRGVMSFVLLGSMSIIYLFGQQRRCAVFLVISYVVSIFLISSIGVAGTIGENLANIKYWMLNTGDVWLMAESSKSDTRLSSLTTLVFSAVVIGYSARRVLVSGVDAKAPLLFGLAAIQVLFLLKMRSLPAFPINYYFVWPSVLLFTLLAPSSKPLAALDQAIAGLIDSVVHYRDKGAVSGLAKLVGVLAVVLLFSSNLLVNGKLTLRQMRSPAPDEYLVSKQRYGLEKFLSYDAPCVFQWANEGIFSFLAKKPYCTKYGYAVYISKSEEQQALQELMRNPPELIVYDSPYWSVMIYGRSMRERLPRIDAFIRENYTMHKDPSGYVFATPNRKG